MKKVLIQMNETLEIRRATELDVEAIASLFFDTVRRVNVKDYSRLQIEAWVGAAPDPKMRAARGS